ncbi:response regulator transcription factor [Alkalibacillus almallahensis]|uniref:response regulator transcription factor n=1 Tax=Alkalibacillus almallahensis TaxID=1379154 RepID=UPI001423E0C4|nr:response regulator transcription factor [Alkalibacillus almallahensis]NIK13274.1 DNA-binding response OmpR family regulator [Alkalibacillus almallahensis]
MTHILVVEDEAKIARVLQLELEFEGYGITTVATGYDALEIMRDKTFDLILLDIMLPEMSGLDILKRYRKHNQTTPVIMLTAKDTVEDKVTGLDSGAQDYVTKPFQIEELLARIRAHLRSMEIEDDGDWLNFPPLHLNVSTRDVIRGDRTIELTPKEFDLLVLLLRHPRQVLSREQILNAVWGYDFVGDTNVVDVYVRYLRKKVDQEDESPLIHTVRGVGYVLKDPYETT